MKERFSTYRIVTGRLFYGYVLLWLIIRACSHILPVQLQQPVLSKVMYDPALWFFKYTGIAALLASGNVWSVAFTILLFAVTFILVLRPASKALPVIFTACIFAMNITTNIYLTHSMHYLAAVTIFSVAFWPRNADTFSLLWQGARYYACWLYGSAFLWKLLLGAFWQWDAGVISAKANLATTIFLNPDTTLSHCYYFFLQHEYLLNIGQKLVVMAEGVFLAGFFTRKYDKLLIWLAIFIFASTVIFSDVFFAEQLVILTAFLHEKNWSYISLRFPFLNRDIFPSKSAGLRANNI